MAGWGYNRNLGNTQIEVAWFLQGLLLPLRDIGFLNQLAKVSSSPTGVQANQTTEEILEARTVLISSTLTLCGTIASAPTILISSGRGGYGQLFVRSEKKRSEIELMYSILNNLSQTYTGALQKEGELSDGI